MQDNIQPTPPTAQELRHLTDIHLDKIIVLLNNGLSGKNLESLEPTIKRLGRNGELPHWFADLKASGKLPNSDGKTVGSILEMVFVAALEKILKVDLNCNIPDLKINPARGIDLPDLELGIKAPSENYDTSEPFISAYERLYGNQCDSIVMLTNYQTAKKEEKFSLQILKWKYLKGTQIADSYLCKLARMNRDWVIDQDGEATAKRLFRFLAYAYKQGDWRCAQLLKMVAALQSPEEIKRLIKAANKDFAKQNKTRVDGGRLPLPDSELEAINNIEKFKDNLWHGVINATENWAVDVMQEAARIPTNLEWNKLRTGPLDGQISMSFALQWRYDFARIFKPQKDGVSEKKGVSENNGVSENESGVSGEPNLQTGIV
jgi:hypothetical protein